MEFALTQSGRVAVLIGEGDWDDCRAPVLRQALLQVPDAAALVLLDVSDVTFLDSSALGVILAARHRLEQRSVPLHLLDPRPIVRRVLDIMGLQSLVLRRTDAFPVQSEPGHDTLEQSLDALLSSLTRPVGSDPATSS